MAHAATGTDSQRFTGVIPPVITPLTSEGEFDRASFARLIEHHIAGGVDGLFILGSSGEVGYYEDEMRDEILGAAVEIIAGRVPVMVGVIDSATRRVIKHVRRAEAAGVDAVVVTAPYYANTGPEEIENHLRAIGAATSLPVFAYDIPVNVHVKFDPDMLVRLGVEGVIAGVKDSSGDDVTFRRLIAKNRAAGSPLVLLTGHEVVVDGTLLAGGDGSVPGLGNVDPAGYVRMDRAARAGDWDAVREEQDRLAALFEIVFVVEGKTGPARGVGAFKTALWLMGIIDSNVMSAPMTALQEDNIERVRAVLLENGVTLVR